MSASKAECSGSFQYDHWDSLVFGLKLSSMLSPSALVGATIVHNNEPGQFGDGQGFAISGS